jgi:hypothetical protein
VQHPVRALPIESAMKGDRVTTEKRLPDNFRKVLRSLLPGKASSRVSWASPHSTGVGTSSQTVFSLQTLAPTISGGLKQQKQVEARF